MTFVGLLPLDTPPMTRELVDGGWTRVVRDDCMAELFQNYSTRSTTAMFAAHQRIECIIVLMASSRRLVPGRVAPALCAVTLCRRRICARSTFAWLEEANHTCRIA
jgi:hypothetical protein